MAVPSTALTTYRVKIYDSNDGAYVYAESQNNVVVKGDVILSSPGMASGNPELWFVDGFSQPPATGAPTITWSVTGGIALVDILLDTDSGNNDYTDFTIASGIGGGSSPYSWTIPNENDRQTITSDKCRVRVRGSVDTSVYADFIRFLY